MTIGGKFIPGNTTVVTPRYVVGRCKTLTFDLGLKFYSNLFNEK